MSVKFNASKYLISNAYELECIYRAAERFQDEETFGQEVENIFCSVHCRKPKPEEAEELTRFVGDPREFISTPITLRNANHGLAAYIVLNSDSQDRVDTATFRRELYRTLALGEADRHHSRQRYEKVAAWPKTLTLVAQYRRDGVNESEEFQQELVAFLKLAFTSSQDVCVRAVTPSDEEAIPVMASDTNYVLAMAAAVESISRKRNVMVPELRAVISVILDADSKIEHSLECENCSLIRAAKREAWKLLNPLDDDEEPTASAPIPAKKTKSQKRQPKGMTKGAPKRPKDWKDPEPLPKKAK
ncbi:hypothetical protein QAD02_005646 [Eretmocerus hayati]|uniref:Uncharacterized protein n=1 Tax=Eretmocerus hayati TaxID=131215 RepID=A0ACC2NTG7_9HYME|nr:hypothetical protein QAD02_005646 [Eretmocerus hayati]